MFLIPAALLSATLVCQAQDTPEKDTNWENTIETDGPDFTEAASLIPAGTIQIETGISYESDEEDGLETKTLLYPATLVRIGLLPSIEARLIGSFVDSRLRAVNERATSESKVSGLAPVLVGVKLFVCEEKGIRPQAAFLGHLTIPSGSRNFKSKFMAADFRFSFAHTLSDRFDLGYNLGYEWDGFSAQGEGIYTLALGYSLTKRWSTYVELYGDKPEGESVAHAAAGGVKFLLSPNWQMDISGGHGISPDAIDYYIAYGFRLRLPH